MQSDTSQRWGTPFLLAVLVLVAYAPALNNGFISDDYVMFGRLEDLGRDPWYLFRIPPETFRATCYGCFAVLRALFGYYAPAFYAIAMALHLFNAVMLWRLLSRLPAARPASFFAAVFFAVFQNPQEGVMWLAGMNESLMTACVLGALAMWLRGRLAWFAVLFAAALFSKESALILLLLVPLADWYRLGTLRFRREYFVMALPVLPFAAVYWATRNANALLQHRLYEFHPAAAWVLVHSLHRMLFPWGYLALLLAAAGAGLLPALRRTVAPVTWTALCIAPYVLLTYQNHIPSRNQYLASTGIALLLALLTQEFPSDRCRAVFFAAFVFVNIGYLWTVKDRQYVARSLPTSELTAALSGMTPRPVLVLNFPGNPWIGRNTALTLPGWKPSLLHVNEPESACPACPRLTWNAGSSTYIR